MTSYLQYNATMATASMTMASHSLVDQTSTVMSASVDPHVMESAREELIDTLKSSMNRYARSNDRRMALRSLKDARFLAYIPLEAAADHSRVPVSELEKEAALEKVLLNGVLLKPRDAPDSNKGFPHYGTNSGCVDMLKAFAEMLVENSTLDGNSLYHQVTGRLSRTSASAEIYCHLDSVIASDSLIVQEIPRGAPTKKHNEEGPINLKLYNTGGQVQMLLERTINFGLFREKDVVINRPWIVVKCKIHERTNLSTNESFRSLNVVTPTLY